ncbi:uncharacterized protein LOC109853356 isoform X3 [Pseudomyrmex gracilis]|nr:uncharacterized protein LOC109853356 isoform X3 [Pseudomyrmex gracilis]XP_020280972.1 uncharacterized protein LOC109853356 isoform X3 [Pseudomyrmex gracilis]
MAEGGPIIVSTSQQPNIEDAAKFVSNKFDESKPRENVPKERNANPSVVPRKGVEEKIKARKGVDPEPERTNVLLNQTTKEDTKPIIETSPIQETLGNTQTKTSGINIQKLNTTNLNNNLDHSINFRHFNTSLTNITASHTEFTNKTSILKISTEKHIPKPKPTVTTVDGPEVNESRPLSRTKSFPLGMPRKIDYIVPVIITMIALPILGAALFILYRRGRDCWDKRHYRRMDFLIDGMYND